MASTAKGSSELSAQMVTAKTSIMEIESCINRVVTLSSEVVDCTVQQGLESDRIILVREHLKVVGVYNNHMISVMESKMKELNGVSKNLTDKIEGFVTHAGGN